MPEPQHSQAALDAIVPFHLETAHASKQAGAKRHMCSKPSDKVGNKKAILQHAQNP